MGPLDDASIMRALSMGLHAISGAAHAGLERAVRAAEDAAVGLDAVPDDRAPAMRAQGRERVDRTFEAVEDVPPAAHEHLEALVVVVVTDLALRHGGHRPFLGCLLPAIRALIIGP